MDLNLDSVKIYALNVRDGEYEEDLLGAIKAFIIGEEYRYHLLERMKTTFDKDYWFEKDYNMTDLDVLAYAIYDNIAMSRISFSSEKFNQIHLNYSTDWNDKYQYEIMLVDTLSNKDLINIDIGYTDSETADMLIYDPSEIILSAVCCNINSKLKSIFKRWDLIFQRFIDSENINENIIHVIEYIKRKINDDPHFTKDSVIKFIYKLLKYSYLPLNLFHIDTGIQNYSKIYKPLSKNIFIQDTLLKIYYNTNNYVYSNDPYENYSVSTAVNYICDLIDTRGGIGLTKQAVNYLNLKDPSKAETTNKIIFDILNNIGNNEEEFIIQDRTFHNFELKNFINKKTGNIVIFNCNFDETTKLDTFNSNLSLKFIGCRFNKTNFSRLSIKNIEFENCYGEINISESIVKTCKVNSGFLNVSIKHSGLSLECYKIKNLVTCLSTLNGLIIKDTTLSKIALINNNLSKAGITICFNELLELIFESNTLPSEKVKEDLDSYLTENNYKIKIYNK